MSIFELEKDRILQLPETSFSAEGSPEGPEHSRGRPEAVDAPGVRRLLRGCLGGTVTIQVTAFS